MYEIWKVAFEKLNFGTNNFSMCIAFSIGCTDSVVYASKNLLCYQRHNIFKDDCCASLVFFARFQLSLP